MAIENLCINHNIKVYQLHNRNQFCIKCIYSGDLIYQSYNSVIAYYDNEEQTIYLDIYYWDYSNTTLKHLYIFLKEECNIYLYSSKKDILKAIKKKKIKLKNLN